MRRAIACCLVSVAVIALGASAALAGARGKPAGTFNGCPTGLMVPPSGWQRAARGATKMFVETTYATWNRERHWGLKLAGAEVGKPFLVRHWLPSGWIKTECGLAVWQRSIGVSVRFPAMEYPNPKGPCNACAHVVLLLGATSRDSWRFWGNY